MRAQACRPLAMSQSVEADLVSRKKCMGGVKQCGKGNGTYLFGE